MHLVGGQAETGTTVGLRSTFSFPRVPCILLLWFYLQLFKSPSCGQGFGCWKSSSISGTPQWLDLIHWRCTFFPQRKGRVTWEGIGGKWAIPMGCVCKQIIQRGVMFQSRAWRAFFFLAAKSFGSQHRSPRYLLGIILQHHQGSPSQHTVFDMKSKYRILKGCRWLRPLLWHCGHRHMWEIPKLTFPQSCFGVGDRKRPGVENVF